MKVLYAQLAANLQRVQDNSLIYQSSGLLCQNIHSNKEDLGGLLAMVCQLRSPLLRKYMKRNCKRGWIGTDIVTVERARIYRIQSGKLYLAMPSGQVMK